MAVGLAACNAEQEFFTGPQLYDSILKTEFEGVSGTVRFDNDTGTRSTENLVYAIINVFANDTATEQQNDGYLYFTKQTAVLVNLPDHVQEVVPFVYAGGTHLTPPAAIPPLDEDMNLISTGLLVFGWTMAGIMIIMAVAWFCWTIWNQSKPVVKASQPAFLCMVCIGAFIMASSIIPMGLQEPVSQRGLDIACMSTPWLLSVGFVTSFSALFAKTWRLNKVRWNAFDFMSVKRLFVAHSQTIHGCFYRFSK